MNKDNLFIVEHSREIILEHFVHPSHKLKTPPPKTSTTHIQHQNNTSCQDEITLFVNIQDNIITKVKFLGQACGICVAAADILCDILVNKPINEALKFLLEYNNMISHKKHHNVSFGELLALQNVYRQPTRIKCATLASNGILMILSSIINTEKQNND